MLIYMAWSDIIDNMWLESERKIFIQESCEMLQIQLQGLKLSNYHQYKPFPFKSTPQASFICSIFISNCRIWAFTEIFDQKTSLEDSLIVNALEILLIRFDFVKHKSYSEKFFKIAFLNGVVMGVTSKSVHGLSIALWNWNW